MHRQALIAGLLALLLAVGGCREDAPPLHWTVVFDGSNSGLGLVANHRSLQALFNHWVQEALHRPSSSFVVLLVGQTRDTTREVVRITVPATWGSGVSHAQKQFVVQGQVALGKMELEGGSAIAEAIQLAALRLREHPGIWRLTILSDLRQFSPRKWAFERTIPDPAVFIHWLEQEHLLADLRGINVEVVGVHSQRGPEAPEFTATQEAQLRTLWNTAFQKMGATHVELRSTL